MTTFITWPFKELIESTTWLFPFTIFKRKRNNIKQLNNGEDSL